MAVEDSTAWEPYDPQREKRLHEQAQIRVTPGENRPWRINAAARVQYFDDVDGVSTYIDRDGHRVGFRPGTDGPGHVYSVSDKQGGLSITPNTVLRAWGVTPDDLEESHQLDLQEDDDTGIVYVDLSPVLDTVTTDGTDGTDTDTDTDDGDGETTDYDNLLAVSINGEPVGLPLDDHDPEHLAWAYDHEDGTIADAADWFDIAYKTVYQRLRDYDIHDPDPQPQPTTRDDGPDPEADGGQDHQPVFVREGVDATDLVDALDGATSKRDVQRALGIPDHGTVAAIVADLGLEDALTATGTLDRETAEHAVQEVAPDV